MTDSEVPQGKPVLYTDSIELFGHNGGYQMHFYQPSGGLQGHTRVLSIGMSADTLRQLKERIESQEGVIDLVATDKDVK